MDPTTFKCPSCEFINANLDSLRIHCSKKHSINSCDLRLALFHEGVRPKCECGCGGDTRFINVHDGFNKFIRGHQSRVNNNWGHNETVLKKSQDVRREMHKHGEIKIWNKGETKETDERIATYAQQCSKTILSDSENVKKRSDRMRANRLDGTIKTLFGPEHSQWKGGTSKISYRCHGSTKLFNEWKFPHLKRAGFKCERCGSNEQLQVHHNKEKMADIIKKFVREKNPNEIDDWTISTAIVGAVVDYHISSNVSGEVICKKCHKKEHPKLNFK